MAKPKVTISKKWMRQQEKECWLYEKTYRLTIQKNAIKGLVGAARKIMHWYYKDYNPRYYTRTYNFRDNSTIRPYRKFNNRVSYGGVYISSEGMDDYTTQYSIKYDRWLTRKEPYPAANVWHSAWVEGKHGSGDNAPTYRKGSRVQAKTPLDHLVYMRDKMIKDIQRDALDTAKKQNYTILRWE